MIARRLPGFVLTAILVFANTTLAVSTRSNQATSTSSTQLNPSTLSTYESSGSASGSTTSITTATDTEASDYESSATTDTDDWYLPKYYAHVADEMPDESDVYSYEITYGNASRYQLMEPSIGSGTYSKVYKGIDLETNQIIIMKVLKEEFDWGIQKEVMLLDILGGQKNTIGLLDKIESPEGKLILIFEYVDTNGTSFDKLSLTLSDHDIRYYFYKMLQAMDYAHSKGIINKDVKCDNVVVNHPKRLLRIIDWGIADFYRPDMEQSLSVVTWTFRGPEIFLGNKKYDYAIDIWAMATIFAQMIFRVHHTAFFNATSENSQLDKIARVFGSAGLKAYAQKFNLDNDKNSAVLSTDYPGIPLSSYITKDNAQYATSDAVDLLSKMFVYDHTQRITATDALLHPYFDPVRGEV